MEMNWTEFDWGLVLEVVAYVLAIIFFAFVIPWLKANGHEGLVKTKEEVAWADLKKLIAPAGSMALIGDTGEIIEGIEATVSPDEFKIE